MRALLTTGGPRTKKLHGRYVEFYGSYQVMLNVDGIRIYTRTYVTTDSDQMGQIYLGQEVLKVRRIGNDAMMEQDAVHIGYEAEKGLYVFDTDASVVAISGILHQEQEWNERIVLRPIAYDSKVLSDSEMKNGAPTAEMFAVVTFMEKYRVYLGSAPFKLRVDNRALSWLKMYSMDQSNIGRCIVRLDGYHMIIEHRMRDRQHNADSLSKKTEFHEILEQKQANQAEVKEGFSFLNKETYEALPLTR